MSADQDDPLTLAEHAAANPVAPGFAEEFRAGAVMAQAVAEEGGAEVAMVTDRPGLTQAQFDDLFHKIFTSQAEQADQHVLVEDLPGGLAAEVMAWSLFNQLEVIIQRLPEDRRTVNAAARLSEARMWLEQLECDEWQLRPIAEDSGDLDASPFGPPDNIEEP